MRYIALLRAINTPPRHVKMDRLREVFRDLGFRNVETVIASGNVLFDTDPADDLVATIEAGLADALEFEVPTFLLTAAELDEVIAAVPFADPSDPIEVSILPSEPDSAAAANVEASAAGIDDVRILGRAVYWQRRGTSQESRHSEVRVMRTLGMETTRRALATLQRIADRA